MIKCYKKICPKCGFQTTKKDGMRRWRQSYQCCNCKYVWISKKRTSKPSLAEQMYNQYAIHKQTYQELSSIYGLSKSSVQTKLDSFTFPVVFDGKPKSIILLIDTTYFWRDFWVMVFIDSETNKPIHYEIVHYETNEAYKQWILHLQKQWRHIQAIVCDWRRWLLGWFQNIPTQMCHFHQSQIIRRNITKNPKLQQHKELKSIVDRLPYTEKESFIAELDRWHEKNKLFLNERAYSQQWKRFYKHKKLRTAYNSLKRNLPYLFVYLDYLHIIDIPNTTNWAEWFFSHFKYKVNLHRWLTQKRKLKLIKYLLLYSTK